MVKNAESQTPTQNRGRPPLAENEKKRPRNLSLSQKAWIGLETQANLLGINSISELNEQLGLGKLRVTATHDKNLDIPIYRRLKSFIEPPVAIFWSLLSFVRRTAKQLAIIEQFDDNEDLICDVVKRAITIVFFVGYTHPDYYINNPSALMRWLSYRILLARLPETFSEKQPQQLLSDEKIDTEICTIYQAISMMEEARLPYYTVLRMKILDGLTLSQIRKILSLQKNKGEISEEKIRKHIKIGLEQLRETLEIATPENLEVVKNNLVVYQTINSYFKLASLSSLSQREDREKLEEFLLKAENNNELDFWIDEINFNVILSLFNSPENYSKKQERIRQQISNEINEYIKVKIEPINRKLAFCVTKEKINQLLEKISSEEAGCELRFHDLINNRHYL
ncbi:MAG: hypothetical protein AB4057_03840 [Crocosphaera sp.]